MSTLSVVIEEEVVRLGETPAEALPSVLADVDDPDDDDDDDDDDDSSEYEDGDLNPDDDDDDPDDD